MMGKSMARGAFQLLLIAVVGLTLSACDLGVSWNSSDKENAKLIFESLEDARRGANAANQLPDGWQGGSEETQPVIDALDDAIIKGSQVRSSVLTKAHPELGSRFRLEYMRSLRDLRDYYQGEDLDSPEDPRRTLADFTDWFYGNQHEFRWWRGYRDDVGLR